MNIIFLLVPFSLLLALLALAAFWWTVRNGQYDDPMGDAERILIPEPDAPPPDPI
jgi:cbb3-type cytochrome oxidase maturation protein